ncbi:MAG: Ig-like domain-containing protein [Clostridia bacterium]|nr:Ig-like domain-containing protein [Clostridia bacterium]
MNKRWAQAICAALMALAVLAGLSHGAAKADINAPENSLRDGRGVVTLFLNSREIYAASGFGQAMSYCFTPQRSGEYVFHGLPGGSEAAFFSARAVDAEGRVVGLGSGIGSFGFTASLTAGVRYELRVSSQGRALAMIEVMENAYGRSVDQPIRLSGGSVRYVRAIVSARDTHWYSFVPPRDGWYVVRTESAGEGALDTRGVLLDDRWQELAQNDDILFPGDGNFRMCVYLTAGRTCFIRVSAGSNQTGSYRLIVAAPEGGEALPARMTLSETSVTLKPGESQALSASLQPENALADIAWAVEDSSVAVVGPDGVVTGVSAGRTVAHAFAGQLEVVCEVNVTPIALMGLAFETPDLRVAQFETARLRAVFTPENASDRRLIFESEDESVAVVDAAGVVTGVSPGETVISARSAAGIAARAAVTVTEPLPSYRALVLGEQNYETGRTRLGGLNTAEGVAETLRQQSVNGRAYEVRLQIDSTRESLIEGIGETFGQAREDDVSLIYINCHGDYDDTAWIELHDGTRVTAVQLEQLLRGIPGRVMVIVDCCRSGAFLGDAEAADRFTCAVCDAFRGGASSAFESGKYIVMTSAGPDEDSYRRSFAGDSSEESMAAILARSLCEGAGWDIIGDKMCTLKADANRDRVVTLQEIWQYTHRRVLYYLEGTGVTQTVRVWPEGDQTPLFGRE